jgi:hypothetical protein
VNARLRGEVHPVPDRPLSSPSAGARKNDLEAGDELDAFLYGSNGALVIVSEEEA